MKHNCYGRDREMVLEWRCTKCGETLCAEEFEEQELTLLEHSLNEIIGNSSIILDSLEQYQGLIALREKVRRM